MTYFAAYVSDLFGTRQLGVYRTRREAEEKLAEVTAKSRKSHRSRWDDDLYTGTWVEVVRG